MFVYVLILLLGEIRGVGRGGGSWGVEYVRKIVEKTSFHVILYWVVFLSNLQTLFQDTRIFMTIYPSPPLFKKSSVCLHHDSLSLLVDTEPSQAPSDLFSLKILSHMRISPAGGSHHV